MKATLTNFRQSPRKMRLVADALKGKAASTAHTMLTFVPKKAAEPIQKLLASAIANAENMGFSKENLVVKNVRVDKGIVFKRFMPRAFGRASRINRRSAHVTVELETK